jgi:PPK2 family polyphosphate:nucleotide phosphotransferase
MANQPLIPPASKKVQLKDYDPGYTGAFTQKEQAADATKRNLEKLQTLQETFYAEGKRSVLVVLQGIDTGGKDGAIRHLAKGLNPQGVKIAAFKAPTQHELAHDFLWRIHQQVPPKGYVGIFNRSHYEDVLIVRVHDLVPKAVWKERYDHINRFEELLQESGTTILKFFLYISKAEQKERLEERRDTPEKQWKFALGDLKERAHWNDYMAAYEEMLSKCNTPYAPWHIVPANNKWYRNYIIGQTLVAALEKLDPQYPPPPAGLSEVVVPD